ncbi:aminotransferase class V-fold PLP-dependent enzyme [Rhodobacter sp. Har01]|uniref:aminotransferase class V-fold PLP-dependent enzyme n=1 Tax=Rhodobacter sp. Har01 TaxID=2883999 RepID=UPI001D093B41|nr:aminotransferase class V-fold PLP-dependent enzyme [Rhodobacter sp. Har01]MCB6177705.1 aminotransferase class V-fold PLP-dependent enzyme [Rhodobacter sp. Har01]
MDGAYFLYHSIGMYPGKARDLAAAMAEFALTWGTADDAQWGWVLPRRQRFIDRWRGILNAAPGSVTTCENVTAGLHAILAALPDGHLRGRSLLVAADCFPSNHFLLQALAPRFGFTLKTVPLRQGAARVEDEDFLDAWTPDVGLALLTWVSSTTSARIDLARAVAHGRRMGALVGVDITQGAGLLPFDVTAPEVDFALSTSLKWMCGTPGAGVLYVSPRLVPHCAPQVAGWFSQDNPFNWDIARFAYAPDMRRFDSGTPGCMAAIASLPALDWHAGQDHAAIRAQNRRLTARLFDIADALRLATLTPREEERRGGSVMLRLPETVPAAQVVAGLRAEGVSADHRSQTLRLSPGVLTTEAGVARLEAALARLLRG